MTKTNKLLLSLGTMAAITAPLATTVACGKSLGGFQGKYNTTNDGEIKLWSTHGAGGDQMAALEEVVDKYNQVKEADAQPVKIVSIADGYDSIPSTLTTKFEGNDKITLPNLVMGYPDHVGTVARYQMQLDLGLGAADADGNALAGTGVDISDFDESFTSINDEIGGIEEGGFYAIPLGKSIDMMTLNRPVMKHFFQEIVKQGGTVTGTLVEEILNDATLDGDIVEIAKTFVTQTAADLAKDYAITDDIFTNAVDMLDFSIAVNKSIDVPDDYYAIGFDSITNFMYTYGYSMTGDATSPSYDDFFFSKGEDGYIEYQFSDKDSEGYKNFAAIYGKLEEAMNEGSIFIRDTQYSSDFSKNHKMGISIGSTAGYSYNYVAGGITYSFDVTAPPADYDEDDIEGTTGTAEGYRITSITGTGADLVVNYVSGSFTNQLYPSDSAWDTASSTHNFKSTLTGAELAAALKVDDFLFRTDDKYPNAVNFATKSVALTDASGNSHDNGRGLVHFPTAGDLTPAAVDAITLQEEEMDIMMPAGDFDGTGHTTSLLQGPSIFGVHSNEVQNEETRDFIAWLYGASVDFGDGAQIPATRYAAKASYILPTTDFLGDASNVASGNAAQKLTFDTVASIQNSNTHFGFDNPVDYTTAGTRDTIKSGIVSSWNAWYNSGAAHSLDRLYQTYSDLNSNVFG